MDHWIARAFGHDFPRQFNLTRKRPQLVQTFHGSWMQEGHILGADFNLLSILHLDHQLFPHSSNASWSLFIDYEAVLQDV